MFFLLSEDVNTVSFLNVEIVPSFHLKSQGNKGALSFVFSTQSPNLEVIRIFCTETTEKQC